LKIQGISDQEFAKKLGNGLTTVTDWRFGRSLPADREIIKEIGLSLSMKEGRLCDYLLSLGYSRLYPKNPLDKECLNVLREKVNPGDTIGIYQKRKEDYRQKDFSLQWKNRVNNSKEFQKSAVMLQKNEELEEWLLHYAESLKSYAKTVLPNKDLILYITLFLDPQSIIAMYETGELPVIVRDLISPLASGRGVSPKMLRNKLIYFGISKNMNANDIDLMLEYSHLRKFTSPETPFESALLLAVRHAHLRFPIYEYDYLISTDLLLSTISKDYRNNKKSGNDDEPKTPSLFWRMGQYGFLIEDNKLRLGTVSRLADDYYNSPWRDDDDITFEYFYTAYSKKGKKCLANYVMDIMALLAEDGDLDKNEVTSFFTETGNNIL